MMTSVLALPSGDKAERPRSLTVATALVSAGVAAFFLGLLAIYYTVREAGTPVNGSWIPATIHIRQVVLTMQTVGLGLSCVTVAWAVWAIRRNDRRNTYVAIGLTFALGLMHLNSVVFLIKQFGVGIKSSVPAGFLFVFTGAQLAVTVGGLLFLLAVGLRTLGGNYRGRDSEGVAAAAMFWYVTVAMWVVVWAFVLVKK
jgi:heme/copper-type cytochrome/quinol oxidase subunit 3